MNKSFKKNADFTMSTIVPLTIYLFTDKMGLNIKSEQVIIFAAATPSLAMF